MSDIYFMTLLAPVRRVSHSVRTSVLGIPTGDTHITSDMCATTTTLYVPKIELTIIYKISKIKIKISTIGCLK